MGHEAPGADPRRHAVEPPARFGRRRPLGDEVRDAILEELIASGATPAGARLPAEAALCERYGVSRVTVRAALRSLQDAGYITIRQGLGSMVMPQSAAITSGIDRLCSFETYARAHGLAVGTAELEIEELPASGEVARRLRVEPGSPVLLVQRVKLYDGHRIGWIVDYVPEGVLPFETIVDEFAGSVLDVLLAHRELDVEYADCDVVPVVLKGELARRLEVRPGSPALYLDELTCTRKGRVVNWSQAWLTPEHLRFCVRRRRQFR